MAEAAALAAAELKLFNESIAPSFADSNKLCPVNTPWELRDKNGKVYDSDERKKAFAQWLTRNVSTHFAITELEALDIVKLLTTDNAIYS